MKPIQIKRQDHYGTAFLYVCDPSQAVLLQKLTGRKTLKEQDLDTLRALGFEVEDLDLTIRQLINA